MSSLANLEHKVNLRVLEPPKPKPLLCISCEGEAAWLCSTDYTNQYGEADNWSFSEVCPLCQGTGFDDPLLAGIMSGELRQPVEE
jgi:hypothetical protein